MVLAPPRMEDVKTTASTIVLDREQLREVTLDDEELMKQLLDALIQDTEKHMPLIEQAIRGMDRQQCARLAHYCKGACSNIGAQSSAWLLELIERHARLGEMDECGRQLLLLAGEIDKLRAESL